MTPGSHKLIPPSGDMRVALRLWGRQPPEDAVRLLRRLAAEPFVREHIAAMPDLHLARHVAVGTVFATEDVLVPSALGGDLGCGVAAVRFDTPPGALDRSGLQRVLSGLAARVPVGDAIHRGRGLTLPEPLGAAPLSTGALKHARERLGGRHLGTLGGGNHFLELDRDGSGALWLLAHSGSRGMGSAIGAHHAKAARAFPGGELPVLRVDEEAGQACAADLRWALEYARENRNALLAAASEVIANELGATPQPQTRIDVHHNFARAEVHFGRELWVHRKGAIAAAAGTRALIPGSMGTASYIVEGQGHPLSFASASHGAGRVLSRTEARAQLRPERLRHQLRRVVFDESRLRALVEEAPSAYRDIGAVLEDEDELVRPILRLEPVAVLKG